MNKHLDQFLLAGISVRTTNQNSQSKNDIAALWERFLIEDIHHKIQHKINDQLYVIYTDYEGDYLSPYRVVIGCSVSSDAQHEDIFVKEISASTYRVFHVSGKYPSCLIETWQKIWASDLDRAYQTDIEIYPANFDPSSAALDVLISIPEKIVIQEFDGDKQKICNDVLHLLPAWFGSEIFIQDYVKGVSDKPMFVAKICDEIIGLISIKFHNKDTVEIYLMGVKPDFHRQGVGHQLVEYVGQYLKKRNFKFLTVKTLSPEAGYEPYLCTYHFYQSLDFSPLEDFGEKIWGKENPCLFMLRVL